MNAHIVSQAHQQLSDWLSHFQTALDQSDFSGAISLFHEECYWRDLVAFTWNIKTAEGKEHVQAMLAATVPQAQPGQWQLEEAVSVDHGVVGGWFSFETAVARGRGHLRLKDGKCWTLFTAMSELKGFEEKKGYHRVQDVLLF